MKCVVELSERTSLEAADRIRAWLRYELSDSVFQKYVNSVELEDVKKEQDTGVV